jgi:hypothetical protein
VRKFLDEIYHPKSYDKQDLPTFEELFTQIELALYEEKYLKGWPRTELNALRSNLLLAANSVIMGNLPSRVPIHNAFVDRLFQEGDPNVNPQNTSFLSFNYDLALDRVLLRNQETKEIDVDYGTYFRSFDKPTNQSKFRAAEEGKGVFLLKMHGSFNWTWCPTCDFARIYPLKNKARLALVSKVRCGKCGNPMDAVIVPPAWRKTYRNLNIANIWSIAGFLLSQAELVVFVGYSFADADMEFKFLLRRALVAQKKQPTVMVVSDEPEENNPTHERYRRFFGDFTWLDKGFEGFSRAPIHAGRRNPTPRGTKVVR